MDLSFSIVAKVIQQGWDKAKSLIADLSRSFDGFAGKSAAHWAKFGAWAATAFAAVVAGARSMRDGVLRELEKMEAGDIQFTDMGETLNRKARKVSSQDEKDKLVEQANQERRDIQRQYENLKRREDSQDPLEKARDYLERKMNATLGLGNFTDDERQLKALGDRLTQITNKVEYFKTLKVESRFDKYAADRDALEAEQNRLQDAANTLENSGPIIAEEKAQKALNEAKEKQFELEEALRQSVNANDEQAETNLMRQVELVKKLTATLDEAKEAAKNFQAADFESRKEYRNPWGGLMGGGVDMDSVESRGGGSKPFSYGPGMGGSLTRSNVGRMATRMRSSIGSHVSDFSTPAYLARAMASREGKTGAEDQQDPRLIEMKKQTKIQEELLKKTGAAP